MYHILIVDDEKSFTDALAPKLKNAGYEITVVHDGDSALNEVQKKKPHVDLVLLDVNLNDPELDGYQVCLEIKNLPHAPLVFMLTGRESVHQHKFGLEYADDYLTKSSHQDLWLARIKNRLKTLDSAKKSSGVIVIDEHLQIDTEKRIVYRDKQMIRLTPLENDLLRYLADRRGELVRRSELFYAVWGVGYEGSERTMDKHIATLRKKIEGDSDNPPKYILTKHKFGYQFCEDKG